MNLKLICVAMGLAIGFSSFAQVKGGHDAKLAKMYTSGKYEICLFKAEDICDDPEGNHEAEPHLYAAMCYMKLYESPDPEIAADYKDGVRKAIQYTQKFIRKDAEGELYAQNTDFIDMLKKRIKDDIKTNFDKENYTKAATASRNYEKMSRETDYAFLYYSGIVKCLAGNSVQGEHDMSEARTKLADQIINGSVKIDPIVKSLMVDGILKYTQTLISEKRNKDAESVITLANKLFPDNGYITVQYNMIVGKK